MINLVLAEAELELVPEKVWNDPCVQLHSKFRKKRPYQMLLDASHFPQAVKKLEGADRRGRPDIIHRFMLLALDSPIARRGQLKLWIHTRNNLVIDVKSGTRPPRHYDRFVGLMEQLLVEGELKNGRMSLLDLDLKHLLVTLPKPVYVMDPSGQPTKPDFWVGRTGGTYVIGGFSEGGFQQNPVPSTSRYSLSRQELTSTAVLALLTGWWEL
ncbi:MAG TPA: 16S rRNA methyltransferase [archaeon]|nr:16S rRNA methyltransferase [archaeon]